VTPIMSVVGGLLPSAAGTAQAAVNCLNNVAEFTAKAISENEGIA
jgi:hypothetical protein